MMRKTIAITTAILLLATGSLTIAGYAASPTLSQKSIEACYDVQIEYNGAPVTGISAPFISDNTTYVPLRMLVEAFQDKQITWDNDKRKVVITGTALSSTSEQTYMQQITNRNAQITELQNTVASLQSKVSYLEDELEDSNLDTDDLADTLYDYYSDYGDDSYSFSLSGDEEDLVLTVSTDSDTWGDLSTSSQTTFLQTLCSRIWRTAEDADITGTVKDSSTVLTDFSADAGEDITLSSTTRISVLENSLNSSYGNYYSTDIDIGLSGDSDDLTVVLDLDSDEWDTLGSSHQENLLQDICDNIWDIYDSADICVLVRDGSNTLDSDSLEPGDSVDL